VRHLFAWVSSFTRNDSVVNQAVHQLTEIARERVNSRAGMQQQAVAQGYQRARLRQTVREYLDSLGEENRVSSGRRAELVDTILARLIAQDLIASENAPATEVLPRKAA